jgi:phospholipid/cholesterol/gamma-HCH transport system substrate-binding protein
MRRRRSRVTNFGAGIIAIVVIAIACYLVFGGSLPFSGSSFVLKAAFTSSTQLQIPSPVRIAGVNVGQVTSVQRLSGSDAGTITMNIDPQDLPIHADATMRIRTRIFLEGNFYVDLSPGTPTAPVLKSGATLPAANTAGPVQLDRVLGALTSDARANLQTLLIGLGSTLDLPPTAAQDATADPSVRGLTAGQALNKSLNYSAEAFKASAIVNQALLGLQPRTDLSQVVVGNEQVFRGLAASSIQLGSLVATFNATMATFASRQQDLAATIRALPPLLNATNAADSALDASFPPTQAFAAAILPSLSAVAPTITVALPWLAQATDLVSNKYLGGLLQSLTPAVQNTASAVHATTTLLSGLDQFARCVSHNLVPTGNEVISDPPQSTGLTVYQELYQSAVGLAGAAGNFDGNGRYIRSSAGGGAQQVQTSVIPGIGPLYGNAVLPPLGTRPAYAGAAPPINRTLACYKNAPPKLNKVSTGAGP